MDVVDADSLLLRFDHAVSGSSALVLAARSPGPDNLYGIDDGSWGKGFQYRDPRSPNEIHDLGTSYLYRLLSPFIPAVPCGNTFDFMLLRDVLAVRCGDVFGGENTRCSIGA